MTFNALTGEEETPEQECKLQDGAIVVGPVCSYCGNNKWKINLAKKMQYCTNTFQCGRSIPLQNSNKDEFPVIYCEELQLQIQEDENK